MTKKSRRTYIGYVAAGLTGMAMTATARSNENRQETGTQSDCLPIQVRTGNSTTEQDQVILRGEVEDFGGNPYVTAQFLLRKHDPESDGTAFYETYTEEIRVWNPNTYSQGEREGDGETVGPQFSRSYQYQQDGFEKESYQPGDEVDYWATAMNDVRGDGREDDSGTVKTFTVPQSDTPATSTDQDSDPTDGTDSPTEEQTPTSGQTPKPTDTPAETPTPEETPTPDNAPPTETPTSDDTPTSNDTSTPNDTPTSNDTPTPETTPTDTSKPTPTAEPEPTKTENESVGFWDWLLSLFGFGEGRTGSATTTAR